jgi:hypothetical protein
VLTLADELLGVAETGRAVGLMPGRMDVEDSSSLETVAEVSVAADVLDVSSATVVSGAVEEVVMEVSEVIVSVGASADWLRETSGKEVAEEGTGAPEEVTIAWLIDDVAFVDDTGAAAEPFKVESFANESLVFVLLVLALAERSQVMLT